MASTILVKEYREIGWELLDGLSDAGFEVQGAYWQYLPDSESWRLHLVTPLRDRVGSNAAYTQLQEIINKMSEEVRDEFSVMSVTLVSPDSKQAKELRERYGVVEENRARVRRISLDYDEAYLYFLQAA